MFTRKFKTTLTLQREAGLYRKPPVIHERQGKYIIIDNKKVLNFASNDYLGIGSSEEFRKLVADNFLKYGTSSSSSRLVSGNYSTILEAEKKYAKYFGYDDALFFPSGYQANLGILSAFFSKDDTIIFDKHIHASCVKGITLSGASFLGYKHNSMSHLEKRLKLNTEHQVAVVTESLFSMDGDYLNVNAFKELKDKFGFLCIVDEAHAFGAVGNKGRGLSHNIADIAIGTFGKALGLFGAFVLLPQGFKEYLLNFSSPLIYTTTLPEAHAASAIDLLKIIERCDEQRNKLSELSCLMKKGLMQEGFSVKGDAHILALEFAKEELAVQVSKSLLEHGIYVLPARYPTVPIEKAIIRIGITAMHTREDISLFIDVLKNKILKRILN